MACEGRDFRSAPPPLLLLNNGSLREECLNVHWFETITQARQLIEVWKGNIMRAVLTRLLAIYPRRNMLLGQQLRHPQRGAAVGG
jgi:hypothetical protein